MKTKTAGRVGLLLLIGVVGAATAFGRVVARVHALTQATVKIEVVGGPIIYIDPYQVTTTPADADFILITHNHADHQSPADINRVRKASTVFVSSPPGVPTLQAAVGGATIHSVIPGQRLTLGGVEIETVPMYNISRTNHPRAMNFVGYVLNIAGVRVYHAGDTERIPEMQTFAADVAMLPLGQRFTMTSVQQAVESALDVRARVAIPIHWGGAEGTQADADAFAAALRDRMQVVLSTGATGFALEVSESVTIAEHPLSQTVAPGGTLTLRVQASGSGTLGYQWRRNGQTIVGATSSSYSVGRVGDDAAGDYTVIVTDANGPAVSRMARVVVAAPTEGRLTNLSVRAAARSANVPLIVGCVVEGAKPMLVRAIGPALTGFGVAGAMSDPRLDVYANVSGRETVVATNNDWGTAPAGGAGMSLVSGVAGLRATFTATGAFDLTDATSRDAALVTSMEGARTLHVYDAADRAGVALVEIYDTNPAAPGRLVNVSARNFAGAGDSTMIVGFGIGGNVPKRLLIRGVGPRLASFGVAGALSDPKVELFLTEAGGRSTLFASNDNWAEAGSAAARAAFLAVGAFELPDAGSRDAALVVTVPAGSYTAQVSGVGGATGEALVEVYELPAAP